MASYFQRDKVWFYRFKDIDGKWRKSSSGSTLKGTAEHAARKAENRVARGLPGIPPPSEAATAATFIKDWLKGLTNRNADDDRKRVAKHLLPAFGKMRVQDITRAVVIKWLDKQRASGELSDSSVRHNMHLLSRFFSWAVSRDYAVYNPVKEIPTKDRPQETRKVDKDWLKDESVVRQLVLALPSPVGLMFYVGNRAGLRTGEICGLRLSDFDDMKDGTLRVRYSYTGPLKEDKKGDRVKYAPLPYDAPAVLEPWLELRRKAGAEPESLVFPNPNMKGEQCFQKKHLGEVWRRTIKEQGLELPFTWYQATRHSFVSRNLAAGVSLDAVSASVGHSSPSVTRRYYDHLVRRTFDPAMRASLGFDTGEPGQVVPLTGVLGSREAEKKAGKA